MIPTLVEAAVRALIMALAVWTGLRVFRVSNVLAQKAAWGLVLACAVALPPMMRWQVLPASMAIKIPALTQRPKQNQELNTLPVQSAMLATAEGATGGEDRPSASVVSGHNAGAAEAARRLRGVRVLSDEKRAVVEQSAASLPASAGDAPPIQIQQATEPLFSRLRGWAALSLPIAGRLTVALYLAICLALLIRMAHGLNLAMTLWQAAEIFVPYPQDDPGYGLRMRFSRAVSSPVTIGSGVLLPYECLEWNGQKLRIVLAHERAHIRQGDFYLQLLAGLYTAVFWFSPLGWWLTRKLSELGEAISDRAGLDEAASPASYAQLLLEFAALPRPTAIGVAMARSTNLSHRIERLLNETSFRQAFAGARRSVLLAGLLVPVSLFAATSLIRVEAASQAQQVQTPSPAPSPAAAPGAATAPHPAIVPDSAAAPADAPAPLSQSTDQLAPPAPDALTPGALAPPSPDAVPASPDPADLAPPPPPSPTAPLVLSRNGDMVVIEDGKVFTWKRDEADRARMLVDAARLKSAEANAIVQEYAASGSHSSGTGHGYSYSYSRNGDTWVLVTGPDERVTFSGDWQSDTRNSIDKVRKLTSGKFLWFKHGGKSYFIDDASIIGQIEAMYKPMEELGRRQEELGKQQEALGKQQEELGRKQEQVRIPTPDISKEMAELNEAVAKLNAKKGSTVSQDELADLEGKIGELQGRLGDIQGKMGEREGQLGEMQGKLGEQQGKLGEEQGRLGEEQGRIAEEADGKIKAIIAGSLSNGKAKPVE